VINELVEGMEEELGHVLVLPPTRGTHHLKGEQCGTLMVAEWSLRGDTVRCAGATEMAEQLCELGEEVHVEIGVHYLKAGQCVGDKVVRNRCVLFGRTHMEWGRS
jgi:hypothetical protein